MKHIIKIIYQNHQMFDSIKKKRWKKLPIKFCKILLEKTWGDEAMSRTSNTDNAIARIKQKNNVTDDE